MRYSESMLFCTLEDLIQFGLGAEFHHSIRKAFSEKVQLSFRKLIQGIPRKVKNTAFSGPGQGGYPFHFVLYVLRSKESALGVMCSQFYFFTILLFLNMFSIFFPHNCLLDLAVPDLKHPCVCVALYRPSPNVTVLCFQHWHL